MYGILFAGQGAQKPGMGRNLYETSPAARAVFDRAGDGIKYDCFEADAEWLMQTEVTQPAVYTMDMAAYAALREALGAGAAFAAGTGAVPGAGAAFAAGTGAGASGFPEPSAVAGFSLGEYAAFTAAGIIDSVETGLELVKKRSLLMKEAGTNPDGSRSGAMAAGMGGRDAVLALIEKARGAGILEAVNFNSPQQTVVAGDLAAVERFAALAKEDRRLGVKAVPLPVSGAFHSPIMRPAAIGLAAALGAYTFGGPALPVYVNVTGGTFEEYRESGAVETGRPEDVACGQGGAPEMGRPEDVACGQGGAVETGRPEDVACGQGGAPGADARAKAIMAHQVHSPVQWQKTIESMARAGIDVFIEVGPGRTLSGLVKKIAPGLTALHVEDAESLSEAVQYLTANEAGQ